MSPDVIASGVGQARSAQEELRPHPLKYVVEIRGGMTPSKENPSYWQGEIPWVSPKDMKVEVISDSEDHISEEAMRATGVAFVPPPAVLMVIRGMILNHSVPVALTAASVTLNQDMKAMVPKQGLRADFLAWLLRSKRELLLSLVEESGHGTKALRSDLWRALPIEIPTLKKQTATAAFLDRKTSAIDSLISMKERQIELLAEKRQALITQAVTKGLDPNVSMKDSGVEWLGKIPAHWTTLKLSRLLTESPKNGISPSVAGTGTTPSFSIAAMRGGTVSIDENIKYVSLEESEARRYVVRAGDIFVMRGSGSLELAGSAGLVQKDPPEGCTYPDTLIRLRPGKRFRREFAVALLNSRPMRAQLETAMRTAAGIWKISGDRLSAIQVPVPPVSEQLEIENEIREASRRVGSMSALVDDQVGRLREYRQALISAAVTGKIEIPAEEAA